MIRRSSVAGYNSRTLAQPPSAARKDRSRRESILAEKDFPHAK
jgi:hypothetical protein